MLHLRGLVVYITIEPELLFLRCAGAADALLGCGFGDGKAAARLPHSIVSARKGATPGSRGSERIPVRNAR